MSYYVVGITTLGQTNDVNSPIRYLTTLLLLHIANNQAVKKPHIAAFTWNYNSQQYSYRVYLKYNRLSILVQF